MPSSTCVISKLLRSSKLNFDSLFNEIIIGRGCCCDIQIDDKQKNIATEQLKLQKKNGIIYASAKSKSRAAFQKTLYSTPAKIGKKKTALQKGSIITLTKENYCTFYLFYIDNSIEPNKTAHAREDEFSIGSDGKVYTLQWRNNFQKKTQSFGSVQHDPVKLSEAIQQAVNNIPNGISDLIIQYSFGNIMEQIAEVIGKNLIRKEMMLMCSIDAGAIRRTGTSSYNASEQLYGRITGD